MSSIVNLLGKATNAEWKNASCEQKMLCNCRKNTKFNIKQLIFEHNNTIL